MAALQRYQRVAWALGQRSQVWGSRPMATMKVMSPDQHKIKGEDFYVKNERLDRPLSPHLTIYKFQMTSVLSITHRTTGLIQSGALSAFGIGTLALSGPFPAYLEALQGAQLGGPLIFAAKFALAWPFTFHLFNGCRHLAWDMGWGFQMPDLYKTGWTVVALSLITAAALCSL